MIKEKWKNITGFDEYAVSNLGRIKSYPKQRVNGNGAIINRSECILTQKLSTNGYYIVVLYKNKKAYTKTVHRIIAKEFIPNPENKPLVLHKDDIKTNNSIDNLYWGTYKDNMRDRRNNTHMNQGSNQGNSKLNKNQVLEIRNAWRMGVFKQYEIAEAYDITSSYVSALVNRTTWKHI